MKNKLSIAQNPSYITWSIIATHYVVDLTEGMFDYSVSIGLSEAEAMTDVAMLKSKIKLIQN